MVIIKEKEVVVKQLLARFQVPLIISKNNFFIYNTISVMLAIVKIILARFALLKLFIQTIFI